MRWRLGSYSTVVLFSCRCAYANCVPGLLRTCGSKACAHEHAVSVVRFGSDGQVKIGFVSVVSPGVLCMIFNHLLSGSGCVHRVSGSFGGRSQMHL